MQTNHHKFEIQKMANILGLSRSCYYKYVKRKPSQRELENRLLIESIKAIYQASRKTYGSPRIQKELVSQGKKCSRKRVAKLMNQEEIIAKTYKKKRKSTAKSSPVEIENHLQQNFYIDEPKHIWSSDITYIRTEEGWLYLAVVMDLFSRKVVGLHMSHKLETHLVLNALKQAHFRQRPGKGELIHHSDRGGQYRSSEFKTLSDQYGIKLSMSGKGHCYDNAVVESFFHTLKTEHVYCEKFKTREEAALSLFEYIEVFYNRKRRHSTLGYLSPEEYEKNWLKENIKEKRVLSV